MTTTWSGRKPRELDDATIAEVRKRIGIPVRYSPRAHNEVSSTDSFRHFARAYGDDNPLYNEPDHASRSSWGGRRRRRWSCSSTSDQPARSFARPARRRSGNAGR